MGRLDITLKVPGTLLLVATWKRNLEMLKDTPEPESHDHNNDKYIKINLKIRIPGVSNEKSTCALSGTIVL